MPTRTNPNHATLLTGVLPRRTESPGNAYWSRKTRTARATRRSRACSTSRPCFTVAESARPELVTLAAFSKAKLGHMFSAVEGRQRRPDVLWAPAEASSDTSSASRTTARRWRPSSRASAAQEPDLAVVNLSEVDRAAHGGGKDATADARRHADAAIGRLVADLRASGRWKRSILIVTAGPRLRRRRRRPPSGPMPIVIAFRCVRARGPSGSARRRRRRRCARVRRRRCRPTRRAPAMRVGSSGRRRRSPGARLASRRSWRALAVPGVPLLGRVHPEWGLAHERAGDLLRRRAPGYQLRRSARSHHRTLSRQPRQPREQPIALVIAGGARSTVDSTRPPHRLPPTSAPPSARSWDCRRPEPSPALQCTPVPATRSHSAEGPRRSARPLRASPLIAPASPAAHHSARATHVPAYGSPHRRAVARGWLIHTA